MQAQFQEKEGELELLRDKIKKSSIDLKSSSKKSSIEDLTKEYLKLLEMEKEQEKLEIEQKVLKQELLYRLIELKEPVYTDAVYDEEVGSCQDVFASCEDDS